MPQILTKFSDFVCEYS